MKKIVFTFFIIVFFLPSGFTQGEIDEQQRIFYRNEKSVGIVLHTNGFGAGYRFGKRIDYLNKSLIEADINFVKGTKEIRITNPIFPNNRGFVFGKLNSFMHFSGGYGYQHEIYRKSDVGGVSIRYYYTGGPSLGLYKPIYYEILYPVSPNYEFILETEKFNESIHQAQDIYSKASFSKGLDEITFVPGVYGKLGVNFEYSKYDNVLHAIDVGVMLHAFLSKIPIMANEDHSRFFPSLFVSYRFGKIVDPRAPRTPPEERRRRPTPEMIPYF